MDSKNPDEMTEEELARFYEERRGDLSLWGKKPLKIRVRRGGASTVFTLRLAPEELQELYDVAQREGQTVSDFIRTAALQAARAGESPANVVVVPEAAFKEVTDLMEALRKSIETARGTPRPVRRRSRPDSPGGRTKSA